MKKWNGWFGLMLALVLVLSACNNGEKKPAEAKFNKDEKVKLKVLYFNDQAFYSQYGNVFQAKYPNITFEVVSSMGNFREGKDPAKEFEKLVDENKPDIILMSEAQYEKFSADGKLYALDSVIQQDKFDVENMVPGVIELLKNKGGSKLYGLSPSFTTKALFYNKDLFDKQGIPYPKDKMSWDEVLQLAKRFPSTGTDETRIYGLAQSMFMQNPFDLVQSIAEAKMWSLLDADGKNLTIDTPEWKSLFEQVVAGYQSKSIAQPGNAAAAGGVASSSSDKGKVTLAIDENSNLFLAGRAAMMIDNSFLLNQMDMMKNMKKDAKPFNWGVVTEPVDTANPDVSGSFAISQILGINAQSAHIGAAWEFIKYLHSDEMAKIRSKSSPELISRSAYALDKQGRSLEAFYKLKPNSDAAAQIYPKGFRSAFSKITSDETKAAIAKTKSLNDALAAIKDKGQKALTEANISGEKESEGSKMGGIQQIFIN